MEVQNRIRINIYNESPEIQEQKQDESEVIGKNLSLKAQI